MPLSLMDIAVLSENSYWRCNIITGRKRLRLARFTAKEREKNGEFNRLYNELRKNPSDFYEYTKMSIKTFDYIAEKINERMLTICPCSSKSTTERLFITLRYLTTGDSIASIAVAFRMGSSTVAKLAAETSNAILMELGDIHMPTPTEKQLRDVRKDFYDLYRLPNCVGALDDMLCKIRQPADRDSNYLKNSKYCHLVLQGLADAHYKFIAAEVVGSLSDDGGTFGVSDLCQTLASHTMSIPDDEMLPFDEKVLPNFIYTTDTYPLKRYMLKPYPPRNIEEKKLNFNRELLKAKYCIQSAFGLMCMKWKVLVRTIEISSVEKCEMFIKSVCLLHNIVRDIDGDNDPDFINVRSFQREWKILNNSFYGRRNRGSYEKKAMWNRDGICQYMWDHRES